MKNDTIVTAPKNRDFTIVKNSLVHGRGLFAKKVIPKGTRIIEYAGKRVLKKNIINDMISGLTSLIYVMNLDDNIVVDAERNGNNARFINHCCSPNCIVYFFNQVPYIYALRKIQRGEELNFDYQMGSTTKGRQLSQRQKKAYFPCICGSSNCRGTLFNN